MTRQLYKITFLIIVIFSIELFPQQTIEFQINNNSKFSDETYSGWLVNLSQKNNDSLLIRECSKIIVDNFSANSFLEGKVEQIKINRVDSTEIIIVIDVIEGKPFYINDISLDQISEIDSSVFIDYFEDLIGQQFYKETIEYQVEQALQFYENNGYPFAEISIESIILNEDESEKLVDIFVKLEKKELSKIDKIKIIGNEKTNADVIINNLRLESGEIYSQTKIDQIPIQLGKLRFFKRVEQPTYLVDSDSKGILEIKLEEKNTNTFDGIIGYVPATETNDVGYLTGFVNISLRNLFGTGRSFGIKWQQENSNTQELELKYLEPWIFNYPFNFTIDFFQRKQDSTYIKRIYGGVLEYLATENISASLILEAESIIPSLNKSDQIDIYNSTSYNSGLQLKVDYRDDIYSPTSGLYFLSTYKYKNKNVEDLEEASFTFHNYELDFGIYYSIFKNQVLALSLHAKEIVGNNNFDISDLFQFGGANTLRGYRENQFLGNRILWSNIEYRFMLSNSSYLFGFYDFGYYLVNENIIDDNLRVAETNYGFGVGLSLDTALGIMKVSYAMAESTSFTDGLIHFGLVNEF